MKTSIIRNGLFLFSIIILFAACNKETFIETIGQTTMETADDAEVGYFIFTSKNVVSSCGTITIWIDDKIAGYITADYTGSLSSCTTPPIEGKLIKIIAPVGMHKITATVENECRTFSVDNYNLQKGVCRYYGLG